MILPVHCHPSKQTEKEVDAVTCRRRPGYKLQLFRDEILNVPVCRLHVSLLDQSVHSLAPAVYTLTLKEFCHRAVWQPHDHP
ncbi:hypothetical protein ACRRTK_015804 [Alexandromys fortis]